ncbi:MAG TPA: hypothetical protein V6C76_16590 [Drouetiella sp.]
MSDGQRFCNPSNGGGDDVYRWSGDNRNPPSQQNQSGDRYIYDGSGRNQQQGGDDHDCFSQDRMPGRVRESDYPQTFVQRETRSDGTQVINVIHCKNAYFNQSDVDGADYRRNPQQDFRNYDDNCNRLQQRNDNSYYNGDRSPYNGSYRMPEQNYNQNYEFAARQQQIEQAREQQMIAQQMRQREIEMMRQRECEQQFERQQQIEAMRNYQRQCDEQIRIQMYNQNCRDFNGRYPYANQPYYENNNCYGNNGNYGYGYPDRYDSRYGGPCFGGGGYGGYGYGPHISIRLPIGHGGGLRIGF